MTAYRIISPRYDQRKITDIDDICLSADYELKFQRRWIPEYHKELKEMCSKKDFENEDELRKLYLDINQNIADILPYKGLWHKERLSSGNVFSLFHASPRFFDGIREGPRIHIIGNLLEICRSFLFSLMQYIMEKKTFCNSSKVLTIDHIRKDTQLRTKIQDLFGNTEIWFLMKFYPEYFYQVMEDNITKFTIEIENTPYFNHQFKCDSDTDMINIIREIYRKQWTLDEFLAQAFRIDEYEIKSRVIKVFKEHLSVIMAISSSEKRKGILRPFDVIEERLAKLNTSNFAYYLIGEDYCDSQPVSRIFSSENILRFLLNEDFSMFFCDPIKVNSTKCSEMIATDLNHEFDAYRLFANPEKYSFDEWEKSELVKTEMLNLTDYTLNYGNPEPSDKKFFELIFDVETNHDYEWGEAEDMDWFYFFRVHPDVFKFDLIKKTVSFIKIDTEENNMPSLSQLRELVADDDDDLEEPDGSDMDVEPRSQDDVCLDELPALASDVRREMINNLAKEIHYEKNNPGQLLNFRVNGNDSFRNILIVQTKINNLTIEDIILAMEPMDTPFHKTICYLIKIFVSAFLPIWPDCQEITQEFIVQNQLCVLLTPDFFALFPDLPMVRQFIENNSYLTKMADYQLYVKKLEVLRNGDTKFDTKFDTEFNM